MASFSTKLFQSKWIKIEFILISIFVEFIARTQWANKVNFVSGAYFNFGKCLFLTFWMTGNRSFNITSWWAQCVLRSINSSLFDVSITFWTLNFYALVSIYKTIYKMVFWQATNQNGFTFVCGWVRTFMVMVNQTRYTMYKQKCKNFSVLIQMFFEWENLSADAYTLMSDGAFLNDLFINKREILPSVKGEEII